MDGSIASSLQFEYLVVMFNAQHRACIEKILSAETEILYTWQVYASSGPSGISNSFGWLLCNSYSFFFKKFSHPFQRERKTKP